MEAIFSQSVGWGLLASYLVFALALTWIWAGVKAKGKEEYLAAGHDVGSWQSGFSIAATWIWAPALFVAAQKAYTQGWVGVFWFTVPNVGCLIVFSWFAKRIRSYLPRGYTLSAYIRETYSPRVHKAYTFQLVGLSTCSFAVQLLAGGAIVSALTGISFWAVTLTLSGTALAYSLLSGLRASLVTDHVQMLLIAVVIFGLVPWVVFEAGGMEAVKAGFFGASGEYTNLFSGKGLETFWAFGIPVTIGLMSGPFGDQSFWQRAFATKQGEVGTAFVKGALIFAIVPLFMALLGFVAAGTGLAVQDVQLTNLAAVLAFLPQWTAIPFAFMLLSGLVSTLDSCLCAVSSIVGHDLDDGTLSESGLVRLSRFGMVALALVALVIANVPDMKILYLFLFYGTLRAATLLPTALTLALGRLSEPGVFWGIVASVSLGLPVFAWAKFTGNVPGIIIGSLATVLLSGTIAVAASVRAEKAVIGS